MSDAPRDPDLSDLLALHHEQVLDGVRTHLPGVIVAYDKDKQRASIQVLIQDLIVPEEGTDYVPEVVSIVNDVPVMQAGSPRGRITFPIKVGDYCLLAFCSSAISNWLASGGGSAVDPVDPRRHDLTDAIAIVGLHNFAEVPTDAPDDAIVVHVGAGISIKLGSSSASQAAILGNAYRSAEDTLLTALGLFATALGSLNPATAPAAATTLNTAITTFKTAAASYLSSVVKLE